MEVYIECAHAAVFGPARVYRSKPRKRLKKEPLYRYIQMHIEGYIYSGGSLFPNKVSSDDTTEIHGC